MSKLPEYPTPIVRISPGRDENNREILGDIIGGIADLDDSTMRFVHMSEYGYPDEFSFGLYQDKNSSIIYLQPLDHEIPLFTLRPKTLVFDGEKGIALMALSNFCRDAWIEHLKYRPMYQEGANHEIPLWRRPVVISNRDPSYGGRAREEHDFFFTFSKETETQAGRADFERLLFNYRDRAHYELNRTYQGMMATMRDNIVKGCASGVAT